MLNTTEYNIVLGSQSPRRKQLLEGLNVPFSVEVRSVDETVPIHIANVDYAEYLSKIKTIPFRADLKHKLDMLLITADTTVLIDDTILNKPANDTEAQTMLRRLSGKKHIVLTGVAITTSSQQVSFTEASEVYFKPIDEAEIDFYIQHAKPFDKAGGYGIQDWLGYAFVERINGCFYNVMGLPTSRLYHELKKMIR